MARQRKREKRSDDTYNARRRFIREAERFVGKMNRSVGAEKDRYKTLAKDALTKASELYERKGNIRRSGTFNRLANELNMPLSDIEKAGETRQSTLIRQSERLVSVRGRERTAQAILDSPIGSRIYGGLVDVWAQPTYNAEGQLVYRKTQQEINQAIMDYFGVDSMMDVIEIIEKQGIDLYSNPESAERYDEVTLSLMRGLFV